MKYKTLIKGQPYTIEIVDRINISDTPDTTLGLVQFEQKKIYIRKERTKAKETFVETLAHELWHAYLYECGLHDFACDEPQVKWYGLHTNNVLETITDFMKKYKGTRSKK